MKTETVALPRHCEELSLKKWAKNRKKHLHYHSTPVKFNNYESAGIVRVAWCTGTQEQTSAPQTARDG
jgi:hypothetical protein